MAPAEAQRKRVAFGKEAQRRERALPQAARGVIRSLCRRGSEYGSNPRRKNKLGRKVIKNEESR